MTKLTSTGICRHPLQYHMIGTGGEKQAQVLLWLLGNDLGTTHTDATTQTRHGLSHSPASNSHLCVGAPLLFCWHVELRASSQDLGNPPVKLYRREGKKLAPTNHTVPIATTGRLQGYMLLGSGPSKESYLYGDLFTPESQEDPVLPGSKPERKIFSD